MDAWILFLATVVKWNKNDWINNRMVLVGNASLCFACWIYVPTLVLPEFVDMSSITS